MLGGKAGDGTGSHLRAVPKEKAQCGVGTCASAGSPHRHVVFLAAFQSQTRPRATIQAPAGISISISIYIFFLSFPCCLQHCSHFPDGVLKARHKKSPNSSKLLQTTKL